MSRSLVALLALSLTLGCGSRTAPHEGDGGVHGGADAASTCTDPPWLLFEYIDSPVAAVYAMRPDGTAQHRVAFADERILDPTVSPDGRFIAYVILAGPLTPQAIGIYDVGAGTTTRLSLGTNVAYPAFSPDASLISYADGLDLHVVHRDGTGDRTLITGPFDIGCCGWGYSHPAFFDATTILWTTAGLVGSIQADGTGMRTLLMSDFIFLPYPNLALSPDRTHAAALTSCSGGDTALRVYSMAALPAACDSAPIVIDMLSPDVTASNSPNPAWGPTDLLAFGQGSDVYVVSVHGGTPVNLTAALTASGGDAGNPAWAPGCIHLP